MSGSGDIIPLWSRDRPAPASAQPLPVAADRAAARVRRARGYSLMAVAAAALLVAGIAVGQWNRVTSLRHVPPSIRAVEYRRALQDAEETCARPESATGMLRQHCVDQAQFLILFPECDARCRGVVEAILPRARR
jgi:hypothetical protein